MNGRLLAAALLLVEGLKRTGRDLSRSKFVATLETVQGLNTGNTLGIRLQPEHPHGGHQVLVRSADLLISGCGELGQPSRQGLFDALGTHATRSADTASVSRPRAPGAAFVTPAGHWHGHVNESGEDALLLPIQDAALHTYLRSLDIRFT